MNRLSLVACVMLFASGCVTVPPPVSLSQDFWTDKEKSVAVVVQQLPEADYMTTGQQGLLDLAINEGANSSLNDYLQKLDFAEFVAIANEFESLLISQGMKVSGVLVDYKLPELREIDGKTRDGMVYAIRDYRPLKTRLAADRLLLISVPQAGVVRSYYGFIPTGEPMVQFVTEGRIVDLESNRVLWRAKAETSLPIKAPWDEPPAFPNITSAFYKSMAQSSVKLRNEFRVMPAEGASPTAADAAKSSASPAGTP